MAELTSSAVLSKTSKQINNMMSRMPKRYIINLEWVDAQGWKTSYDETQFLDMLYNDPYLNITAMFNPDTEKKQEYYPLSKVYKDEGYLYLEFIDVVNMWIWLIRYHPGTQTLFNPKEEYSGEIGSVSSLVIYSF